MTNKPQSTPRQMLINNYLLIYEEDRPIERWLMWMMVAKCIEVGGFASVIGSTYSTTEYTGTWS